MAFSYGPLYLTHECNTGPRRRPESNIGTSAKREGQYCLRTVALANISLMSQTWRAIRKKPFYNFCIITLAMQDFRLQCK